MQQRVPVSSFAIYEDAHAAKEILQQKFPDNVYQIRKGRTGFTLFHRFQVNELKAQTQENERKAYKRGKRRASSNYQTR